jgi:protein-disulfide isomerase
MSVHTKPTKRELREQRRAERIEAERAEAAAGARRTRILRLLGVAGLAVAVAIAAAVISSSGSKPQAPAGPVAKSDTFQGIPEKDGVLGDAGAPVTLTEYVDLQCPVCAQSARTTLPTIVRDYVRTGKVKLEARTLRFIGPDSGKAALMAAGAERQGRLWPFLEAFYAAQGRENSGYVTDAFLRSVAAAAGVDYDAAKQFAGTARAQDRVNRADAQAQAAGIDATPTFAAARGDGKAHVIASGAEDPAKIAHALDMVTG